MCFCPGIENTSVMHLQAIFQHGVEHLDNYILGAVTMPREACLWDQALTNVLSVLRAVAAGATL